MPYKSKEAQRAYVNRWKTEHPDEVKTHKKTEHRKIVDTKLFVGVDGEGGNKFICWPDGTIVKHHEYYLIRVGSHMLRSDKALGTYDILDFLVSLPYTDRNIYVSYFFDYDVTMILRDLSDERLDRLVHREKRLGENYYFPAALDWYEFQFDYMPHKYFSVKRRGAKHGFVVHDVGTFFQCSFVRALKRWNIGTPEQLEQIAKGKSQRSVFGQLTEDTVEYNKMEVTLLEELMTEFRSVCGSLDLRPHKWEGPGYLATSMFRSFGTVKNKDLSILHDQTILDAAQASYYGGRFEVSATGLFETPVYEYDIHSAYPYAMTQLPCLEHMKVRYSRSLPEPGSALYLAHGKYSSRSTHHAWGTFPWRSKSGTICFPISGSGWYWSYEIEAKMGWQSFTPDKVIEFIPQCDHKPFDWVAAKYQERLDLGATARGLAMKLVLNSLYGKMAQSVGKPVYSNPIWASLITSITRAKILRALQSDNDNSPGLHVLMVATDAVYSLVPLDLPISDALGDWSCDVHNMLHIIQPGVYFTDKDNVVKSRGINADRMLQHRAEFVDRLKYFPVARSAGPDAIPPLPISTDMFMGLKISLMRKDPKAVLGEWLPLQKEVSYSWISKRGAIPRNSALIPGAAPQNLFLSLKQRGSSELESTRYSREIGQLLNEERIMDGSEDMPDWMFEIMGVDG